MLENTELNEYREILVCMRDSGYYTNHGPKAKLFESTMAKIFSSSDSVAVSNFFVASLMVFISTKVSPTARIEGVADKRINAARSFLKLTECQERFSSNTQVNQSSYHCFDMTTNPDLSALTKFDKNNSHLVTFIINPFSNLIKTCNILESSNIAILSHESGELVSTETGATILSASNRFLHTMRNIRSSYGTEEVVPVPLTANGRFAETQALMGLASLKRMGFN